MNSNHSIAAVVLAAGKGTRMGSELHKVLHEIDGKPMLTHVLDNANGLDLARTVVVVGAGREQIHAQYPELETVAQDEQLGTAHAVRMAEEKLRDFHGIVLVLYGDVPLVRSETLHALCDKVQEGIPLAVLGFRPMDTQAYGRLVLNEAGGVEKIVEHAEATEAERKIGFCNSGILACRAQLLFDLLSKVRNDNSKGEYYLTDVVSLVRAAGHSVATAEADPLEVTGVNSQSELVELNRLVAESWF